MISCEVKAENSEKACSSNGMIAGMLGSELKFARYAEALTGILVIFLVRVLKNTLIILTKLCPSFNTEKIFCVEFPWSMFIIMLFFIWFVAIKAIIIRRNI